MLGGGISGLTATYALARALPRDAYRIVVLEANSRLGGWMESHRASCASGAPLLESGPRSIRPVGYRGFRTIELVCFFRMVFYKQLKDLGMIDRMLLVSRKTPSARNRFLYYGGRLNRLPSSAISAIEAVARIPFLRSVIWRMLREPFIPRSDAILAGADESVHDFCARRFGEEAATTMVSAVIHGIYAGDSRELSVRSVMSGLVALEKTHGSMLRSLLPTLLNARYQAPALPRSKHIKQKLAEVQARLDPELVNRLKETSIYSFPHGLGELITSLEKASLAMPNVEIWRNAPCERIDDLTLYPRGRPPLKADRVISAIPAAKFAPFAQSLPHLAYNPSAHLAVVDVVLSGDTLRLPIEGFGYLVPRNATPNADEILGVILDSDAVPNQTDLRPDGIRPFVKLTVMMGGPYWRHRDLLPTEPEAEVRALRALEQQLGLPSSLLATNVRLIRSRVLRNTIPQYLVGHMSRLAELQEAMLRDNTWRGRLSLLGNSYGGVGVNDCIALALDTSEAIVRHEYGDESACAASTGLAHILEEAP